MSTWRYSYGCQMYRVAPYDDRAEYDNGLASIQSRVLLKYRFQHEVERLYFFQYHRKRLLHLIAMHTTFFSLCWICKITMDVVSILIELLKEKKQLCRTGKVHLYRYDFSGFDTKPKNNWKARLYGVKSALGACWQNGATQLFLLLLTGEIRWKHYIW